MHTIHLHWPIVLHIFSMHTLRAVMSLKHGQDMNNNGATGVLL